MSTGSVTARALAATALALSMALAAVSSARAQAPKEINFGIISTEATANLKTVWEPYLAEMGKVTGLKINAFFASDYAGIIEAQRFDKVQVAWYGNKSAIEAVDRASGEVFAQSVAKDGSPGYYSHLIVHKDSPISKLEDVLKCDKTLDFGNGDPNSTSGFLVPMTYVFAANKIDPKACFKTVRAASHEANALAVANKQVQVATNNSENIERLLTTNRDAHGKIKVVWTSPLIPLDPIVWRKDLDPAVKQKILSFFLSYGRVGSDDELKAQRQILAALGWAPFRPSSNDQLLPIRQLEAQRKLLKAEGDDKLSPEDKAKQVAAAQAELAKLAEDEKAAAAGPRAKALATFLDVDKAGKADAIKALITERVAAVAGK